MTTQPDTSPTNRSIPALRRVLFRLSAAFFRLSRWVRDAWYRIVRSPLDWLRWRIWAGTGFPPDRSLSVRCVLANLNPDATRIQIPPRDLEAYAPGRRHGTNKKRFFWPGDWDQRAAPLTATPRYRLMADIWEHRDCLEESATFREYRAGSDAGQPRRMVNKGLLLDSRERILDFLEQQLALFESMQRDGFRSDRGEDELRVAIARDGRLIKARAGRRRTSVAHILGLARIPVRIAHVHEQWWQHHRKALSGPLDQRLQRALEQYAAEQGYPRAE